MNEKTKTAIGIASAINVPGVLVGCAIAPPKTSGDFITVFIIAIITTVSGFVIATNYVREITR